tara:strand:- start:1566 stop:2219 length:654 start_codon:yes stop_codon:yes gene_type:complete
MQSIFIIDYSLKMKVSVIDYGSGNLKSVCNALDAIGCFYQRAETEKDLEGTTHIILPGVGSFKETMVQLENQNLLDILNHLTAKADSYYLGICVGMQILAKSGDEFGHYKGLGWINGVCKRLKVKKYHLPLPHIGWNGINSLKKDSKLLSNISADPIFYFLNSYAIEIDEKIDYVAHTNYGVRFVSIIEKNNIFGVQFHPEKSQELGLQLLKNFISL